MTSSFPVRIGSRGKYFHEKKKSPLCRPLRHRSAAFYADFTKRVFSPLHPLRMRRQFDQQLALLNRELIEMGALCEEVIAEIVTFLRGRTAEHDDILCQMARATISMVTESVDAYIKHDTIKAEAVLAADDTVDAYFQQVKHALIGRIAADPADGEYALDLLMIAKYFERIGDHATNIAEWVIFSITGRHKEG